MQISIEQYFTARISILGLLWSVVAIAAFAKEAPGYVKPDVPMGTEPYPAIMELIRDFPPTPFTGQRT